ncbi:MAG: DNA polymerase IV [Propionibacteriaceae bacterium]|nr:DNA polymerase IV [Propionibacteriaceae bacterium]
MTTRILHLDLDAFFASVEQRDKPSLRGKPVVVGGTGIRGVVATASYEARVFGIRSAMSGAEARRRARGKVAFLGGRWRAYKESSQVVMGLLREVSPLVEPLSLDEAYVDLAPSGWEESQLQEKVAWLRAELTHRTAGLTASVGVGSSKLVAKLASEAAKPDGFRILAPDEESAFLGPLPVRAIPGVGPTTEQRLLAIGMYTVDDLRAADPGELIRELGQASGTSLARLAHGEDNRPVAANSEAKSISTEDTFQQDLTDSAHLQTILRRDAAAVAKRLRGKALFARTVTIKVRYADFETITRAASLGGATDDVDVITAAGLSLLDEVDPRRGIRLLGIGVSNFAGAAQDRLFGDEPPAGESSSTVDLAEEELAGVRGRGLHTGADVEHDEFGRGWVWGSGRGLITVRFERRGGTPGPVRTLPLDDAALHLAEPEPLQRAAASGTREN